MPCSARPPRAHAITMSTATVDQWKLFVGSGKEYKELKEKQVLGLFSGGKDVFVALLTG